MTFLTCDGRSTRERSQARLGSRYVVTSGAELHVRIGGRGPALVMLHMSPLSSRHVLPLAERLTERFTVVAVDTPGYGESDPLGVADPMIEHYARAVDAALTQLGIEPALVYGEHTGAKIALALSRHTARRSSLRGVVLDGIALGDDDEREEKLRSYTPAIEPAWHGGHLLAAWHQLRAVEVFWPWYRQRPLSSEQLETIALDALHRDAVDMMRAWPDYGLAYRAAFRTDPIDQLRHQSVPTTVVLRKGHHHAEEFARRLPNATTTETVSVPAGHAVDEVAERLLELSTTLGTGSAIRSPGVQPDGHRDTIETPSGAIVKVSRSGVGRPLVILDEQLTPRQARALLAQLPDGRPVDVIDLRPDPDSRHSEGHPNDVASWRDHLRSILETLDRTDAEVLAFNAAAAVVSKTADSLTTPPRSPWRFSKPESSGAHLISGWHALRDAHLTGRVGGPGGSARGPGHVAAAALHESYSWGLTRAEATASLAASAAALADGVRATPGPEARAAIVERLTQTAGD